jgi:hypothetical protein
MLVRRTAIRDRVVSTGLQPAVRLMQGQTPIVRCETDHLGSPTVHVKAWTITLRRTALDKYPSGTIHFWAKEHLKYPDKSFSTKPTSQGAGVGSFACSAVWQNMSPGT